MSPSQRLKPVHNLALSREEQAAAVWRQCREELQRQQGQLQQLLSYQAEYHRRLSGGSTLSPPQLRDFHLFLERLERTIGQQRRLIESLRRRCEERELSWVQARTRAQAIDKAIGRHRDRELREQDRHEQKQQDEAALRSTLRPAD